ncbi:MAG: PEP-CTERM system TPR-repeat protein PrsT [Rhodospirillaceae bacterium]|nr:PEP-CTERM system TPR-repeat protein PrsT [Rhodospirillaceae bacterium]MBT5456592.1 PEP-CTERM system TPR-repeat protein PrsT [Rhodospirillaceae bacterium]
MALLVTELPSRTAPKVLLRIVNAQCRRSSSQRTENGTGFQIDIMRQRLIHRWLLGLAIFATALVLAGTDASAAKKQRAHDKHYEHALELIAKGDRKGAIIELKNALQADPKDLAARVLLGNTYLEVEDGRAAEIELKRARKDGAQDSFVLAPLGQAYVLQGRYKKALEALSVAGQDQTTAAQVAAIQGDAHLALLDFKAAEESYLKATKIRANNAEGLVGLARVKIATDDLVGATRYIKWALDAQPNDARAWFTRGEIARLQRKFDEALTHYSRAVELAPAFARAILARGGILIDQGHHEQAEPDILEVRRLQRRNPRAAYLHSIIQVQRGETKAAQNTLIDAEQILKTYPQSYIVSDPPTQLLAGVVSYFRRDFSSAYRHLAGYLKRFPNHLGARKLLASLALQRGDSAHAIFLLKNIVLHVPRDVEVLTMLGDALMRAKRYREATEFLEKAAAAAGPGSSALSKLVMVQLLAGRDAQAIKMLKSEMKRDADAVRAAMMLCATQLRRGDFKAALETANSVIENQPENAVAHNLAGGAHAGLQKIGEARESFRAAIEAAPHYQQAIGNLAKLEARLGNLDEAAELYASILEQHPKSGAAMLALAGIDIRRNEIDDALRWLEKARADSTHRHVAALRLVQIYILENRNDKALSVARELTLRKPGNLEYLLMLGRARLANRQLDKAVETFKDLALRAANGKSPAWLRRAAIWQARARDRDGARASLRKALEFDPKFILAHLELFKFEMASGNFDAALMRVKKIATLEPGKVTSAVLQGDVFMRMRKFDAALRTYEVALSKRALPSLARRVYHARRALGRSGFVFAERWASRRPDDAGAQRLLARAYADAGRNADALGIYEAQLKGAPGSTSLLNNIALLYQKMSDPRALDYAKRAYDAAPEQAAVIDTYGWILAQTGELDRGLKLLRNAALRAPHAPEIHYHLAVTFNQLGNKEEARRELRAALQSGELFDGFAAARKLLSRLNASQR